MSLILRIAWRYFFSKSTQTVVNRINNIALLVIIVASASLMIVLSAFSGLREFGLSFSSVFDPDYKILPLQGKTIFRTFGIIFAVFPKVGVAFWFFRDFQWGTGGGSALPLQLLLSVYLSL